MLLLRLMLEWQSRASVLRAMRGFGVNLSLGWRWAVCVAICLAAYGFASSALLWCHAVFALASAFRNNFRLFCSLLPFSSSCEARYYPPNGNAFDTTPRSCVNAGAALTCGSTLILPSTLPSYSTTVKNLYFRTLHAFAGLEGAMTVGRTCLCELYFPLPCRAW